jgi:hypothetical protein
VNGGYLYLEVRCLGCDTHQTVALDVVRRPKATPVHELERYMRCKDCSQVRRYAYKRSHLVALRTRRVIRRQRGGRENGDHVSREAQGVTQVWPSGFGCRLMDPELDICSRVGRISF